MADPLFQRVRNYLRRSAAPSRPPEPPAISELRSELARKTKLVEDTLLGLDNLIANPYLGSNYNDFADKMSDGGACWKHDTRRLNTPTFREAGMSDGKVRTHPKNFKDLTGKRFGALTVVAQAESGPAPHYRTRWLCTCDCSIEVTVYGVNLVRNHHFSCGCQRTQRIRESLTTHGHSVGPHTTRAYNVWQSMRQRCSNPNNSEYANYGGRGITVCARWEVFADFLADMGEPPKRMSIDRIDVNGNYEPSNCRWASAREQARNTRRNRHVTYNGRTLTLSEWADVTGLPYPTLRFRLSRNWPAERMLTEPSAPGRRRKPR